MSDSDQTKLNDYKVELDIFEGPLDLLLYLIRKEEVDIYDIPIERITTQYLDYISMMKMLDLNIAGEFIVMAATLMMIKSRMLLPHDERPELVDEDEDDPRWDLVRKLVEYKKFKDAASRLQQRELMQENIFGQGSDTMILEPEDPGLVLQDISLFDLLAAFREALERARPEDISEIHAERFTVADKIAEVIEVVRKRGSVGFSELFHPASSRPEIVCTFLALLELIRLCHVAAVQDSHFGEIRLTARDDINTEQSEAEEVYDGDE